MPVSTGFPDSLGLHVSVFSANVFASNVSSLHWAVSVRIGGNDISAKIDGQITIAASEDAARVASFFYTPDSWADYVSVDGQPVIIEASLNSGGGFNTYRLFSGVVEGKTIDPASRRCELSCRDGYQEIATACTTPEEVESLFGGLAVISRIVHDWDTAKPDPASYFSGLLDTLPGACAISSSGLWRAFPWSIGSPVASFSLADVLDESVKLFSSNRVDSPRAVKAIMTHRFYRLHNAETPIYWAAPTLLENVSRELKLVPRSVVLSAVNSVNNWYVKGKLEITSPPVGNHSITIGGGTVQFQIFEPDATYGIWELQGWFYRRWYQEIDVAYTVTIDMPGNVGREEVVAASLTTSFDAAAWESPKSNDTPISIYARNVPVAPAGPSGYEALSAPWPPAGGHLDHYGDVDLAALEQAMRHVAAKAVRRAVAGRRQQRVVFSRPLDPRFEIGASIGINAFDLSATGQLTEIRHTLDCNSGEAITDFTIACPDGNASAAGFAITFAPHSAVVTKSLTGTALLNYFGASTDTVYAAPPADDAMAGWFCNTGGLSTWYDIAAPVYNEQFRIVLPEIDAAFRDPIKVDSVVSATISIPHSGLTVSF